METKEIKLAKGTLRAYRNVEVLQTIAVGGIVLSTISTQNILGSVIIGTAGIAASCVSIKIMKNANNILRKISNEGKTWTLEQSDNEEYNLVNGVPFWARRFSNITAGYLTGRYLFTQEQSIIKTGIAITSLLCIEELLRTLYLDNKAHEILAKQLEEKVKTLK